MRIGKISESVLKRSVLRFARSKREEVLVGPAVGEDCSVIKDDMLLSTQPFVFPIEDGAVDGMRTAVHRVVNNLAASNGIAVGVMLSILLPIDAEEHSLQQLMKDAEAVCARMHIQIIGGHTEVTDAVNCPVVTITGVGKANGCEQRGYMHTKGVGPGEDLIVTKWIALEGTSTVAKKREEELCARYPREMVELAQRFDEYISIVPEARIGARMGASAMHDITNGGVFAALWEMAQASGVGLDVDLKKIPVRQESIEVCNYLDLNPYELCSGGSLLIAVKNGVALLDALHQADIPAAIIGVTTDGNDRMIRNGEEVRYLEPPKSDQIFKIK